VAIEWTYSADGVDWEELAALYRAAPLGDKKPAALERAFGNSLFKCFAYDDGRLVGAGRVLADGADCAYLCDVAVLPGHQGTGLGKRIVGHLVEASRGHRKIILYAVPGKEGFYEGFGFLRMTTAMAIFENQQQQLERGYLKARDDPPPHTVDAAFFTALERRRTQALVQRDLATLEALHAPEYQLVTPAGKVHSRESYLGLVRAEPFYSAWEIVGDMSVRLSADVAAIRYEARLEFPSGRAVACWHTDLYERRPAGWQAVWSQATEIR
jgi:GNAT superfamily N-acetyltransferase